MSVKDFWFYLKARLNALETLKKKKLVVPLNPLPAKKQLNWVWVRKLKDWTNVKSKDESRIQFYPILKYLKLKMVENASCTMAIWKSSQWIHTQKAVVQHQLLIGFIITFKIEIKGIYLFL